MACLVTSSSPVPLKTRRVGQRCTLNLSTAQTSFHWCGGQSDAKTPSVLVPKQAWYSFDRPIEGMKGRFNLAQPGVTLELDTPSTNYHTTPTGERFSSRQVYCLSQRLNEAMLDDRGSNGQPRPALVVLPPWTKIENAAPLPKAINYN
ncbi:hypothetical protein TNCV_2264321 [Trichonephila clavipes]|nr:hypothetical protein TNCV_2264321 [Trichonephila clavipes]